MRKVLIIDDDRETGAMISQILKFNGLLTFYTNNGSLGIEKAIEIKPDLIICDIVMPKMDGFQVLARIRNINALMYTPFIFLSANKEKNDIRKGMINGADDYLTKPFVADELIETVHSCLRKRSLIEETVQNEVTTLKKEIDSIYSKEKLLSTILNNTKDIIIIFHLKSNRIIFHNERLNRIMPNMDNNTLSILDFAHPEDLEIIQSIPEKIINLKDDDELSIEFRLLNFDGGYIFFSNQVSVFERDNKGYPILYLSILHDITDNKEKLKIVENFYDRISEDLSLAKSTQESLISFEFPKVDAFKFKIFYKSMEKVGGDFLVTKKLKNGDLDIFAGDVSGHGISSSLVSAMAVIAFKMIDSISYLPNKIMEMLHESLESLVKNHFISSIYIRLSASQKNLTISFAGHPPVILIRNNNVSLIRGIGTFLILFPSPIYLNNIVDLEPGDKFLLFSDGFYEAFDPDTKILGLDTFINWVQDVADKSIDSIINNLVRRTLHYSHGEVHDDMTLFGFEYS